MMAARKDALARHRTLVEEAEASTEEEKEEITLSQESQKVQELTTQIDQARKKLGLEKEDDGDSKKRKRGRPRKNVYEVVTTEEQRKSIEQLTMAMKELAYEKGTRQNYDGAVERYTAHCRSFGQNPWPVNKWSLSTFAIHVVLLRQNSTTYLKSMMPALRSYSKDNGLAWLDGHEKWFYDLVTRALTKVAAKPSKRKQPINTDILTKMYIKYKDRINAQLLPLQTITMAYLAHAGLLRGSELINLRKRNIKVNRDWSKLIITIEVSKATRSKVEKQEQIYLKSFPITTEMEETTNATILLREYWKRWDVGNWTEDAYLFPQISGCRGYTNPAIPRLKEDFIRNIKNWIIKIGHDPSKYAGHSFRAGGATDLFEAGVDPRTIQLSGRWASDCFWLYVRDNPEKRAETVRNALVKLNANKELREDFLRSFL